MRGIAVARPKKTPRFTTIKPPMTVKQDAAQGNRARRFSQYAAGNRMTAKIAAMTIGMKIDLPRYRATDNPRKPSVLRPMRVAVVRLISMFVVNAIQRFASGCPVAAPFMRRQAGRDRQETQ